MDNQPETGYRGRKLLRCTATLRWGEENETNHTRQTFFQSPSPLRHRLASRGVNVCLRSTRLSRLYPPLGPTIVDTHSYKLSPFGPALQFVGGSSEISANSFWMRLALPESEFFLSDISSFPFRQSSLKNAMIRATCTSSSIAASVTPRGV